MRCVATASSSQRKTTMLDRSQLSRLQFHAKSHSLPSHRQQQRAQFHSSSAEQSGGMELRHFSSYTADEKDLQYFGKKKQTSVNLKALLETARGDR